MAGGGEFPVGMKVLVVDDNPVCLAVLKKMLIVCRYDATACSQATNALTMLRENRGGFDVIISDVHMPDMDGFRLLELVGLEMDLPVILMSADSRTDIIMKGIKHGACDYLIKPVRMEELKNIWHHVVRKKRNENKEHEHSGSLDDTDRNRPTNNDNEYASSVNDGANGSWKSQKKKRDKEEDDGDLENEAVPKKILELMNVPVFRENVASHLQVCAHPYCEEAPSIENGTQENIVQHEDVKPSVKRQKKSTSAVWDEYTRSTKIVEENGKMVVQHWAQCNHCKYNTRCETINGTTCFWNHLKKKHNLCPGQQQLKVEKNGENNITVIEPYRYDQEVSLRKFYLAIIMHEYPFNIVEHEYFVDFIKSLRPNFPIKSRITVRKELMDIFLEEKKKLYEYFKTVECRFSTTMEIWTSNQNKGYICVTVHWIDDDWQIQKRIIKFMHIEGRYTGAKLSEEFTNCVMRWYIEKKIFSLSLDNASANEVCVKDVIAELRKQSPLVCDGLFFHVRCANHILNLVARDGLQEIASTIQNIRSFILAVKGSPLQWEEFQKCATECGLKTTMNLSLDVATRWNSTYTMLRDALYYRSAFERLLYLERRKYEKIAPSSYE